MRRGERNKVQRKFTNKISHFVRNDMARVEGIEIAAHTACTRNDKIAGMTWGGGNDIKLTTKQF